ncbi:uncharacterized protein LOC132725926 [Ruditapes philippinarum]|uniref:uncharacterized protein LOC132725926 n=1 Tax=Ruditapes philippinarum TaxID=129788 RepID=UPI00295B0676|nr:uncharacterized protein LOC132725926 [Ruditapes philippinarum]
MCDTDMYWNGFRCYRCSYICTSIPSEFCKKECPYYTTPNTDKNISESKVCNNSTNYVTTNTEKYISESNGCDNSNVTVIIILVIVLILLIVNTVILCSTSKYLHWQRVAIEDPPYINESVTSRPLDTSTP